MSPATTACSNMSFRNDPCHCSAVAYVTSSKALCLRSKVRPFGRFAIWYGTLAFQIMQDSNEGRAGRAARQAIHHPAGSTAAGAHADQPQHSEWQEASVRHYDGAASQPPDSHASRPVPELQQNSQVWQCPHVAQCMSTIGRTPLSRRGRVLVCGIAQTT